MISAPQVSIVIPIYRPLKLQATLAALARQTAAASIREVILAGPLLPLDPPAGLNIVQVPVDPPTIPNNRNAGVRAAASEWVCMLDADCLPEPDWLENHLLRITAAGGNPAVSGGNPAVSGGNPAVSGGNPAATAGAVNLPPGSGYWSWCDHLAGFALQAVGLIQPGFLPYAASLNFCLRRAVFEALGGFDPALLSSEDRDFCERLGKAGYAILAVPDAVVIHDHARATFQAAAAHLKNYGRWTMRFRWKHRAAASPLKRFYWFVLKIPLLGHLTAALQSLLRLFSRLLFQPPYRQFAKYLPGVALLEMAFFLGMIETRSGDGD